MPATARKHPLPRSHQLRFGLRVAAGVSPRRAAAAAGMNAAELQAMLEEPDFSGLLEAVRELEAMPAAQRLPRLQKLALQVLECALVDGDIRACLFVLTEFRKGRNPAATLADMAERHVREAGKLPPKPATPAEPRLPPISPPNPNRWAGAAAARLKREVIAEHVLQRPAAAETSAATEEPAADPAPVEAAAAAPAAAEPAEAPAAIHSARPRPGWIGLHSLGERGSAPARHRIGAAASVATSTDRQPRSPQGP